MALNNISAYGIFQDEATVNQAVDVLKDAGFRKTDVSVLFPENLGSKDFAHERHTKAPEGAVAGGSSGAVIGAALGWLAGAGSLSLGGLDPFVVAGPVVAMLGGMGLGTALGGLTGALVGSAVPEYEAKRYTGRVRKGGILLSVHCDNAEWAKRARVLLKQTGGADVGSAAEARADFARTERPMPRHRLSSSAHF